MDLPANPLMQTSEQPNVFFNKSCRVHETPPAADFITYHAPQPVTTSARARPPDGSGGDIDAISLEMAVVVGINLPHLCQWNSTAEESASPRLALKGPLDIDRPCTAFNGTRETPPNTRRQHSRPHVRLVRTICCSMSDFAAPS